MNTAIALQVILICLFITGLVLWVDSPSGRPRDGVDCKIEGCRKHR